MGCKDLHMKPFDKGTVAKLEIFEDYAQAWIPTFVMQAHVPEIHIFDFFAGPGYDCNNIYGSPIRILKKLDEQLGNILAKKTKIVLHLNEYESNKKKQEKFALLVENCKNFISKHPKFHYFLNVKYYNEDAEKLFLKLLPVINTYPSLVYLDQNGVRFISQEYIEKLEKLKTTDFLYFVSSSYFRRFCNTNEFKRILDIKTEELEKESYKNIHRFILNKMKGRLSPDSELKLFPFSIKKKANIFGVIFGAKNYAAVDKFLNISWKRNELNGEADFDIDEDASKIQLELWGYKKLTKIEKFHFDFEKSILNGDLYDNKSALIFTYSRGHIPKHATDILKRLKKESKIHYEGRTPAMNYDNVFRNNNIVKYELK